MSDFGFALRVNSYSINVNYQSKVNEILEAAMDWACGYDGKDKKQIQNFVRETRLKSPP